MRNMYNKIISEVMNNEKACLATNVDPFTDRL